jgi:porin
MWLFVFAVVWHAFPEADISRVYGQPPPEPPAEASGNPPANGTPARGTDNGLVGIDRGPRLRQLGNTPDDVGYQVQESETRYDAIFPFGPLAPLRGVWDCFTDRLDRATGLDLGCNYTSVYQVAGSARGDNDAGGGDFDFFGEWHLTGTDDCWPGDLMFSTETRHAYGDIPPAELGDRIGSLWGTTVDFDNQRFSLVQFYWDHGSFDDGLRYRIGKMDPALIYHGYRYASDNYSFLSPAFSNTLPIAAPDAGLGTAVGIYPHGETYVLAGIHDANGDRTRSGFDTVFGEAEYFTAVEFGVTPHFGTAREGLYHVTLWHMDPRSGARKPSDRGIALTLEQQFGRAGKIVPFFRYAYAHRGLNDVRQNISFGVGLEEPLGQNADLIGLGFSWGQASDRTLRDQYTFEAFYRIFLTPHTHLTPDIQVIIDPSNAPDKDSVVVVGLRLRTVY